VVSLPPKGICSAFPAVTFGASNHEQTPRVDIAPFDRLGASGWITVSRFHDGQY